MSRIDRIPGSETALRLPDFIIAGAPKCGTTSLHFILKHHPEIGIPDNEILFYDADDPIVHADFFHRQQGDLVWYAPEQDPKALEWYVSRFAPFADRPVIGEDSPTYLMSEVAPRRIAALAPRTKLVFTLRDPIARAYSQYWHLVRTGRATRSFEATLTEHSSIVLGSTYTSNLKRFFEHHDTDNIHVIVFEDFARDPQSVIDGLTEFLGVAPMSVDNIPVQYNATSYPRSQRAQQWVNRIGRHVVSLRYRNHMGQDTSSRQRARNKLHYRWFRYINPIFLGASEKPPMRPATRDFLQHQFSARNAGLSQLLGRDLSKVWPGVTV